jgi:hypothetical protein
LCNRVLLSDRRGEGSPFFKTARSPLRGALDRRGSLFHMKPAI